MPGFEYKVLPAPVKGAKAKGVRASEDRFALALERLMNELGETGWQFLRAETLPQEERKGLTQTSTEWRNVLVFRRERVEEVAFQPKLLEKPREEASVAPHLAPPVDPFGQMGQDRAVEDTGEDAHEEVSSITSVLRARAAKIRKGPSATDMAAE